MADDKESLLGKTERCKATQERQGGLKGRDLSGLDCVLIEVTCIKWNLIGTDTGSLTDRHDADGLRRGERGSGERKTEWRRRRGRTEANKTSFCYSKCPNGRRFVMPNFEIKAAEKELISGLPHDWRLMRRVTLL